MGIFCLIFALLLINGFFFFFVELTEDREFVFEELVFRFIMTKCVRKLNNVMNIEKDKFIYCKVDESTWLKMIDAECAGWRFFSGVDTSLVSISFTKLPLFFFPIYSKFRMFFLFSHSPFTK